VYYGQELGEVTDDGHLQLVHACTCAVLLE
jgi:hypothetical protein